MIINKRLVKPIGELPTSITNLKIRKKDIKTLGPIPPHINYLVLNGKNILNKTNFNCMIINLLYYWNQFFNNTVGQFTKIGFNDSNKDFFDFDDNNDLDDKNSINYFDYNQICYYE